MEDLTFKKTTEGFNGRWPSALQAENPDFSVTVFYADLGMNGYAADLAAGALDRDYVQVTARPKDPLREASITSQLGHARVSLTDAARTMGPEEARRHADDVRRAADSAEALEKFLDGLFPPGTERT